MNSECCAARILLGSTILGIAGNSPCIAASAVVSPEAAPVSHCSSSRITGDRQLGACSLRPSRGASLSTTTTRATTTKKADSSVKPYTSTSPFPRKPLSSVKASTSTTPFPRKPVSSVRASTTTTTSTKKAVSSVRASTTTTTSTKKAVSSVKASTTTKSPEKTVSSDAESASTTTKSPEKTVSSDPESATTPPATVSPATKSTTTTPPLPPPTFKEIFREFPVDPATEKNGPTLWSETFIGQDREADFEEVLKEKVTHPNVRLTVEDAEKEGMVLLLPWIEENEVSIMDGDRICRQIFYAMNYIHNRVGIWKMRPSEVFINPETLQIAVALENLIKPWIYTFERTLKDDFRRWCELTPKFTEEKKFVSIFLREDSSDYGDWFTSAEREPCMHDIIRSAKEFVRTPDGEWKVLRKKVMLRSQRACLEFYRCELGVVSKNAVAYNPERHSKALGALLGLLHNDEARMALPTDETSIRQAFEEIPSRLLNDLGTAFCSLDVLKYGQLTRDDIDYALAVEGGDAGKEADPEMNGKTEALYEMLRLRKNDYVDFTEFSVVCHKAMQSAL